MTIDDEGDGIAVPVKERIQAIEAEMRRIPGMRMVRHLTIRLASLTQYYVTDTSQGVQQTNGSILVIQTRTPVRYEDQFIVVRMGQGHISLLDAFSDISSAVDYFLSGGEGV